ncbi:hypothetical protein bcere0025_18680 [Bacillus cereus F65185]|nr:hypothetical protein bcere0023_19590 [Bacillus cereus Rock4-2]EEL65294.1 hypothetical protein bcere0025_18680 [Bacillus cereus F65185]
MSMGGDQLSEDTIVITVTFLLSECNFRETKIEYEGYG